MPAALQLLLVTLAAVVGGAINAVAGGGTLLTFPALIALGVPPIVANATSTVALWPGALGSLVGYRAELAGARTWAIRFAIPSLAGGLIGALLLLRTSAERFSAFVPWLVLGATALFALQVPVSRWIRARTATTGGEQPDGAGAGIQHSAVAAGTDAVPAAVDDLPPPPAVLLLVQFFIGIYGGYFGAGIGILMLATLGFMGLTRIHRMNGLKNWGGMCMNLTAAVLFAFSSLVDWWIAGAMAVGATAGGYAGSRLALRVSPALVRNAIIVIGFASGLWLLAERV